MLRWPSLLLLLVLLPLSAMAEVRLSGLNRSQADNVRAWLSIAKLPVDAEAVVVHRAHRKARDEIRIALQALGHYQTQIKSELSQTPSGWLAHYQIEPGPLTYVRGVNLEFSGPGAEFLREKFSKPAQLDQVIDHAAYESLKTEIQTSALRAGFLNADLLQSQLKIEPKQNRADIFLALETGPKFHFRQIDIRQDILDPEFLSSYIGIREGDVFDADQLFKLRLRLTDLDYFSSIEMSTTQLEDEGLIDVQIDTEPRKPQRYQIGVGYGTDTGARVSLNNEFRRLNRKGHRINNRLRLAESQQQISSQYLIPGGSAVGNNYSLQAQYLNEEFADARTENLQFGVSANRVDDSRLWQFFLNYQLENFVVGEQRQQTELLLPGLSLTKHKADDSLNPRQGYKFFAELKGAHNDVASSDSFVQVLVRGRYIQALSKRSRVLFRTHVGRSFVGAISDLPLSQRFFAGGDQSVRGYAHQSLGPKDGNGDVIGGKHLAIVSLEMDRLFWKNYGAAVFFDYGGASDELLHDLKRGLGLGFRWRTEIGMVRIDFANPVDLPDENLRVHIGIGAEL